MSIEITNLNFTVDQEQQTYTVPSGTASLGLHAVGGDIEMRMEASPSPDEWWTIKELTKETIDTRSVQGEVVYFTAPTGLNGVTLEIRRLTGLL